MSHKSEKIASIIHSLPEGQWDRHYLGFFECFNRQLFFEAHEVLEELWLPQRGTDKDLFYKGLIQLAGAFLHIQKKRRGPAISLFRLAGKNLSNYPGRYESLDLAAIQERIVGWVAELQRDPPSELGWEAGAWPRLLLEQSEKGRNHKFQGLSS